MCLWIACCTDGISTNVAWLCKDILLEQRFLSTKARQRLVLDMRADVDADMELLWCLQEGLGLTAQQEALLLERRRALLDNLRVLIAERNTLCQRLNVSTASHLSLRLLTEGCTA